MKPKLRRSLVSLITGGLLAAVASPFAVADVIVAHGSTVMDYSDTGIYKGDLLRDPTHLHGATAVMFEANQNYYDVISKTDGTVQRYLYNGFYLGEVAAGLSNPTDIGRQSGHQDFYVVNNGSIAHYDPTVVTSGSTSLTPGSSLGSYLPAVTGVQDLMFLQSSSYTHLAVNGTIGRYDWTGALNATYGAGTALASDPTANGNYYYVANGNTIEKLHWYGDPATFATLNDGDSAVSLTMGNNGDLYVSGTQNNYIFDYSGDLLQTFGSAQGWNGAAEMEYVNSSFTPQYLAPTSVPEPSTWVMLLIGVTGIGGYAWRKKPRPA